MKKVLRLKAVSQVSIAPPIGRNSNATLTYDRVNLREITQTAFGFSGFAVLGFLCAVGVLLDALANRASRAGESWAEPVFWCALIILFAPVAFRLASKASSRTERMGLVILLGMCLYLVKLIHYPYTFAFPDESVHLYNVEEILKTGRLFQPNAALPVTPLYPGIATLTASIVSLTGLGSFAAGILVVGIARFIIVLSLFLLYERVTGSPRVAGLAALLYMTNSNFIFFNSEFAYESLALPLAIMILWAVALRQSVNQRAERTVLTLAILPVGLAVIVTHHLTSYALATVLTGSAILYWLLDRRHSHGLWWLALFSVVGTLAWLTLVASYTITYLYPIYRGVIDAFISFAGNQVPQRALFTSTAGVVAPFWDRTIGIISVILISIGLLIGLPQVLRYRRSPMALLLAGGALVYFATLALRFFPNSWEIGNRASEFVFVGVGFVLALGVVNTGRRFISNVVGRALFALFGTIILTGGLVAGWPTNARLAKPYLIEVNQSTPLIEPEGVTAARWAFTYLGTQNRIVADPTNARLFFRFSDDFPLTGYASGIRDMLYADYVDASVIGILRHVYTSYVLVDRRLSSWDSLLGIYFERASKESDYFDPKVYEKFDTIPEADRIFDSGNIVIYDVERLSFPDGSK